MVIKVQKRPRSKTRMRYCSAFGRKFSLRDIWPNFERWGRATFFWNVACERFSNFFPEVWNRMGYRMVKVFFWSFFGLDLVVETKKVPAFLTIFSPFTCYKCELNGKLFLMCRAILAESNSPIYAIYWFWNCYLDNCEGYRKRAITWSLPTFSRF